MNLVFLLFPLADAEGRAVTPHYESRNLSCIESTANCLLSQY